MVIRDQRQDERLEKIEARLADLERLWQAISKPVNTRSISTRGHLVDLMDGHLSEGDLRDAAFELSADYDSLPADGKRSKARELILSLERQSRLYQLTAWLQQRRPNVNWPAI